MRRPTLRRHGVTDLSLCARVTDAALAAISAASPSNLRVVDLSRSSGFGAAGLAALAKACPDLADLDLSNGVDLGDVAVAEVGRMRRLQRLSLSRCKPLADMGLGCVAVGCPDLRELSLKWRLGLTDLGLKLLAHKCKKLRTPDLSYVMVLDISHCQNATDAGVSSIVKSIPNLSEK